MLEPVDSECRRYKIITLMFKKQTIRQSTIIWGLVILAVGFVMGMESKIYQLENSDKKIISMGFVQKQNNEPVSNQTSAPQVKKKSPNILSKQIGDEVVLGSEILRVNKVLEQQSISSSFGSPKISKEGAKFIVIGLDMTNITNSSFSFWPDEVLLLVDNKDREYKEYSSTVGNINNYLDNRRLSPSIKETGFIVYEIPTDSEGYSLITQNSSTNDIYQIKLK